MNHNKTTVLGALTILMAVVNVAMAFLQGHAIDFPSTIAQVTAGVGLIKAADANPTIPKV